MATQSVNHTHAFLVCPTANSTFTWRVVEVSTNRTVSRHRNLRLAIEKAERLNALAVLHEAIDALCTFERDRDGFARGVKATLETGEDFYANYAEGIYG